MLGADLARVGPNWANTKHVFNWVVSESWELECFESRKKLEGVTLCLCLVFSPAVAVLEMWLEGRTHAPSIWNVQKVLGIRSSLGLMPFCRYGLVPLNSGDLRYESLPAY